MFEVSLVSFIMSGVNIVESADLPIVFRHLFTRVKARRFRCAFRSPATALFLPPAIKILAYAKPTTKSLCVNMPLMILEKTIKLHK